MVSSMLIKEPGCQTRSRLTEKLAKVQKNMHTPYYMATPEENQIDSYAYIQKWNVKCTSQKILQGLIQWWRTAR